MPLSGMAAPCSVGPNTPRGYTPVVVAENTPGLVISNDVTYNLAPPDPLRCVAFMLPSGMIVLEDRERVWGWQDRVIWSPVPTYENDEDDTAPAEEAD